MSSKSSKLSKMSMDGWWMVATTVRPVSTAARTERITIAAARASRPAGRGSSSMLCSQRFADISGLRYAYCILLKHFLFYYLTRCGRVEQAMHAVHPL